MQPLNHATTYLSSTCKHHTEITQSHTFAALIRLSPTTHNRLTSNTSEISSNNSEKRSLLADKHFWILLLHSSYSSSRVYSHTVGRPCSIDPVFKTRKKSWPRPKFTLNAAAVCSRLIHLTPRSLFPRPKTWWSP